MKKSFFFSALIAIFCLLGLAVRAWAAGPDWVSLESDTRELTQAGQIVVVRLDGALSTPIQGAGAILRYDPACLKLNQVQPGSLFNGINPQPFQQNSDGVLDITYYLVPGSGTAGSGIMGEGSLLEARFTALAACASDITLDHDTLTLGVVNGDGAASSLSGVEIRGDALHFTAGAALPASETALAGNDQPGDTQLSQTLPGSPAPTTQALIPLPTIAAPAATSQRSLPETNMLIFFAAAGLLALCLTVLLALLFSLRRRPARDALPHRPVRSQTAFAANGRTAAGGGVSLLAENGSERGRQAAINQRRVLIGRHEDCNLRLNNRHISRQHAEILHRDGSYYLADLGSRNGTFLNGSALGPGYYPLNDGDRIQLGRETVLRFIDTSDRTVEYPQPR